MEKLILGDCLEQLKTLPSCSFDSCITDPPAGIAFMGKGWDSDKGGRSQWISWLTSIFVEVERVLKPGSHCLVWALPRTSHWTLTAIEDSGFEIRDVVTHLTSQGFPKGLNIKKSAIAKGLCCCCDNSSNENLPHKNLSVLPEGFSTPQQISGETKQDLQSGLCNSVNFEEPGFNQKAKTYLPSLWKNLSAKIENSVKQSEVLQSQLPSQNPLQGVIIPSLSQGEEKLDGLIQSQTKIKNDRTGQSGLERGSNPQKTKGKLQGRHIRPLPSSLEGNGNAERLCSGTSISNGEIDRQVVDSNGGCSPYRPQPTKQPCRESSAFPYEQFSQVSRTWKACDRCGKPIIPDGLNTALKPAAEFWILARKPIDQNGVTENVIKWGTGGLNLDPCRIPVTEAEIKQAATTLPVLGGKYNSGDYQGRTKLKHDLSKGRHPANLICSEPSLLEDKARFFYCPKASKAERNFGLSDLPVKPANRYRKDNGNESHSPRLDNPEQNHHPTIKPLALCDYLIKLITPEGGAVIDPFMGSGSIGVAAKQGGYGYTGIELNPEYLAIAKARLACVS